MFNIPSNGVFLADDATFPLRYDLFKPYSKINLTQEEKKCLIIVCSERVMLWKTHLAYLLHRSEYLTGPSHCMLNEQSKLY